MINKIQILVIVVTLIFYNCSSIKNVKRLDIDTDLIDDSYLKKSFDSISSPISITTDFYNIVTLLDNKDSYTLNEQKYFDIRIINYGQKDLFIPEWFTSKELKIELYKKNGKKFKPYEQKRILTTTYISFSDTKDRKIKLSRNGKLICIKSLELDRYLKIVDEGIYYAKVYIDLSNFGYFKILVGNTKEFMVVN